MILKNWSIKAKLIFISALSSSIALLVFSFLLFFYEMKFVKEDLIHNLQIQAEIITENSLAALAFMDDNAVQKTLGTLKYNPDIMYAGMYDAQQQLLGSYRHNNHPDEFILSNDELVTAPRLYESNHFVQIIQPVYLNDELLGHLVLQATFDSFNKKLQNYFFIILGVFVTTLLLALYLSSQLQRIVSRPIINLVNFIHDVTESKKYNLQANKESNDEFGDLIDAFNEMLVQLNLSFQKRDEAQQALSHNLTHLEDIVSAQTLDLQKSLEVADAANRSKSDFLANMSHEIRTPMNAIIGMTYLVQRTNLNDNQRNHIDKIGVAAQALLSIINDILDFSKIEAGKLALENTVFSLDNLLSDSLDILKIKAEQKNVPLFCVVSPDTPRQLLGDSLRLGQILVNLISNAVKFTSQGEVVLTVTSKNSANHIVELCFSIRDTGIGMTDEQINSLFQPFSQADSSITRQYGGSGLGLTICKQLATLMGGEISVNSVYGTGSTFTFTVTLAQAAFNQVAQIVEKLPIQNYHAQQILLVDDNEINQEIAYELLTSMGLQVQVANNGKEGLTRALAEPFDLILMDIQMPIMDGLTATRLIRLEKSLDDLPIVAMTAHAMQGDKEKSLAAGMNDHLTKPIEVEKLVAMLNRWLKIDSTIIQKPVLVPKNSSQNSLPNTLPPFDLVQALKFSNQNATLLHELLLNFRSRYADSGKQLAQWIDSNDCTQAAQLAHSLKGVAGTLGASELRTAMEALEIALSNNQLQDLNQLLQNATIALTAAIEAAMTLPLLPERPKETVKNLNPDEFQLILNQFNIALKSNNFNATEIFNDLKRYLLDLGLHQETAALSHWLNELDFQQASVILARIHEFLKTKNN
ncbi:MAG: ATP-binding protein [Methylococcaceae bacterium]